jgi:hypothetical protein
MLQCSIWLDSDYLLTNCMAQLGCCHYRGRFGQTRVERLADERAAVSYIEQHGGVIALVMDAVLSK